MKVGIIGAGTMGSGIAQVFAKTDGYYAVLCDIDEEARRKGLDEIRTSLSRQVSKGKLAISDVDDILSKIETGDTARCADCDLIVEAAVENMEIKKSIFRELEKICDDDCLLTTNTSSLSVTELSASIDRQVIGMHFFNPAPAMALVEVIRGIDTDSDTVDSIVGIVREIRKTPVIVNEAAGFVVNRILVPMINEAIGVYSEGTASAEDIDTSMKLGANHPMGPLALGDLIGLDVVLAVMKVLQDETGDTKYRPHPLLRKMVRGMKLGRKTGLGFYSYR